MTRIEFASWVPTVTGRLSFSVVGLTDHPSRAIVSNVGDGGTRMMVIWQRRYLGDALPPFRGIARRLGLEGDMWFVCVAGTEPYKTHPHEKLAGRLFIFHNETRWNVVKEMVLAAQERLDAFPSQTLPLTNYAAPILQELSDRLQMEASLNVPFFLRRTGETFIAYDPAEQLWAGRPKFDPPNGRRDPQHEVVSQTFYFLRDIAHTHQHHDPYTDTIVDLYRLSRRSPERRRNKWRDSVLFTLYGKIVHFKKAQKLKLYHSSAGVLAYARSFADVSAHARGTYSRRPFNHQAVEQSLNVGLSLKAASKAAARAWWEPTVTASIPLLGLFIAVVALQQLGEPAGDKPQIHPAYAWFTKWILSDLSHLLIMIALFPAVPLVIKGIPLMTRVLHGTIATLQRLSLGLRRRYSVPLALALSALSLFAFSAVLARVLMP